MWKVFLIFVLFISFSSYGQNFNVVGKVVDNEDGRAVSFCNIYDLNQQFGVQSNDKGEFELSSIPSGTFLIFQAIGYINDTVEVKNNKDYYRIFLKQEKINLAEIVVTGVTRRTSIRENPVPITPISREQLEETSESNIIDILVKNSHILLKTNIINKNIRKFLPLNELFACDFENKDYFWLEELVRL